ncbi:MAG: T9SS type A sorting domain-containing protein [Ignavibacteria bacterium]|nr:T9SS type A sorting domain-containing protein [Ignavibacteria bacterium]
MKRTVFYFIVCISLANAQQHWSISNSPTSLNLSEVFFRDSLFGWIGGDSGMIFRTTNSGNSWEKQMSGVTTKLVDIYFLNNNLGWALTWTSDSPPFRTQIVSTTDGGIHWLVRDFAQENIFMNDIYFSDSENGWLGGHDGALAKTTNGGNDWRMITVGGTCSGLSIQSLGIFSPKRSFASGGLFDFAGVLWKQSHDGEQWTAACLVPEPVQKLAFIDSLNIIGVGGDYEFGASVIRSTDGGETWNYSTMQIFGIASALSFRTSYEGWATLGAVQELIFTKDSGKTWNEIFTPDSSVIVDIIFPDSIHGFAVGLRGVVCKYNIISNTIGERNSGKDFMSFHLQQNYPNPMNSTSIFSFELSISSFVELHVFDLSGRVIETIVNEYLLPGSYSKMWRTESLASGVYFYRLQTANSDGKRYSETKKMLLMK